MADIVIAGGGIAALEAALALREHSTEVGIEMICPERTFTYRPLSVLEAFGGPRLDVDLGVFAHDIDVALRIDRLEAILPGARTALTWTGASIDYEDLLVAVGAAGGPALPGADTFGGPGDTEMLDAMLTRLELGDASTIAFVAVPGQRWILPLYELALLARRRLTASGRRNADVLLITPERDPLESLGEEASEAASLLLASAGVRVWSGVDAIEVQNRVITQLVGPPIPADYVVTLPRLRGRRVAGLPSGVDRFVAIDGHARVEGLDHVYVAGDLAAGYPEHGGLAARQAVAAAESMLADRGVIAAARPFDYEVGGVLLTPLVLERAAMGGPWQPPTKVFAAHLADYLHTRVPDSRDPGSWATSRGPFPTEIEVGAGLPGV